MRDMTAETIEPGDQIYVYSPDNLGRGEITTLTVKWVESCPFQGIFVHGTNASEEEVKLRPRVLYLSFSEADDARTNNLKEFRTVAKRNLERIEKFIADNALVL